MSSDHVLHSPPSSKLLEDGDREQPIRVGLLGLGVVGGGTLAILRRNNGVELTRRVGRPIRAVMGAARNVARAKQYETDEFKIVQDPMLVATSPDVDIVVEVMGGIEPAYSCILAAIAAGKHVITANKALLANKGTEIFAAASARGVQVAFESAVAGGIPIIKAVREGLAANRIEWIAGIINGTSNFILSTMRDTGVSFQQALAQAQALGYAEADPTFDVQGIDAAHKLTILSAIGFGIPMQFDKAYTEGIATLEPRDIRYAEELGYRIKLLGITKRTPAGIELRVHPTLIPAKRLIANVEGVMNAIVVKGDAVGPTLYYGPGAGAGPTGSAVVADLIDVARLLSARPQHRVPYLAFQDDALSAEPILSMDLVQSSYYLRMHVEDRPGVLADVARILADRGVSIEAMIQKEPEAGQTSVDIVFLIHQTVEGKVNDAIAAMQALPTVKGTIMRIRRANLDRA